MVILVKEKWFTLFIASEPQLRNPRTLKTTGAVGWDLWLKSTQVWESCLSFGCMGKGPWRYTLVLWFSCNPYLLFIMKTTSLYIIITVIFINIFQKTHSNKVVGPNVCFNTTFTYF